jgi:hypothetical protein
LVTVTKDGTTQLGGQRFRYYLGAHVAASPGGGKLFRSDDDGATWTQILKFASGPSVQGWRVTPVCRSACILD